MSSVEPENYQEIVAILASLPTARSRMFFASHGLGTAFDRPGKGWGRMQRVNEALAEANQAGKLQTVLEDARRQFVLRRRLRMSAVQRKAAPRKDCDGLVARQVRRGQST
jgi:hypothetical protein